MGGKKEKEGAREGRENASGQNVLKTVEKMLILAFSLFKSHLKKIYFFSFNTFTKSFPVLTLFGATDKYIH